MILIGLTLLFVRVSPQRALRQHLRRCRHEARTMKQYLDFMRHVREHGARKDDRTGTGTLSVFGYQMRFDLAAGLPAGDDQERALQVDRPRAAVVPARRDQHALSARARRHDLGRVGGRERRARPGLRQAMALLAGAATAAHRPDRRRASTQIRRNPDSRRIIVSAWNVGELER